MGPFRCVVPMASTMARRYGNMCGLVQAFGRYLNIKWDSHSCKRSHLPNQLLTHWHLPCLQPRPAKPLMSDDLSISGFASCGLRKSSLINPSSILDVDCVRIVSSATMLGGAYFELYPSTGGAHLLANHGAILTTDGDATLVRIKKRSDI